MVLTALSVPRQHTASVLGLVQVTYSAAYLKVYKGKKKKLQLEVLKENSKG